MDFVNQSRKFILQSRASLESKWGVRLSYARWLAIFGIGGFYVLEQTLSNSPITLDTTAMLLGGYAAFNLIAWLISLTFGRGKSVIITAALLIDVIVTIAISVQFTVQVFFFPYIFALLIMLLVGLWEGLGACILIAGANIATIISKVPSFDFKATRSGVPIGLELTAFIFSLLIFGFSVYILTLSSKPLARIQDELLEEAVAKANTASLIQLQNRVRAIYRVATTLSATLDYQQVIDGILGELGTVFDVTVGAVLLFDENSNLRVESGLRLNPNEHHQTFEVGQGLRRDLLMRGEPTLINGEEAKLKEIYNILPSMEGCPSVILMPMRVGYEVFGLVIIASRQSSAYVAQDVEWVVALTSHPVVAIQNAKLLHSIVEDRNKRIRDVEEVKHNLARNLHDGPAQTVASFSMQAEFIRRLIKSDPDKAVAEVNELGKTALQTSKEIRTLLYELRPLILEADGLVSALEQYAARFPMTPDDPKAHFSATNFSGRLSPNVETTIFTVLQEAVNNARKHAKAKNIWLSLATENGYVVATAKDDGQGFDVRAVETKYELRGSLGMTNMRERASLVNGTTKLESYPGRGTVVTIRIPLNESNTTVPPIGNGMQTRV